MKVLSLKKKPFSKQARNAEALPHKALHRGVDRFSAHSFWGLWQDNSYYFKFWMNRNSTEAEMENNKWHIGWKTWPNSLVTFNIFLFLHGSSVCYTIPCVCETGDKSLHHFMCEMVRGHREVLVPSFILNRCFHLKQRQMQICCKSQFSAEHWIGWCCTEYWAHNIPSSLKDLGWVCRSRIGRKEGSFPITLPSPGMWYWWKPGGRVLGY